MGNGPTQFGRFSVRTTADLGLAIGAGAVGSVDLALLQGVWEKEAAHDSDLFTALDAMDKHPELRAAVAKLLQDPLRDRYWEIARGRLGSLPRFAPSPVVVSQLRLALEKRSATFLWSDGTKSRSPVRLAAGRGTGGVPAGVVLPERLLDIKDVAAVTENIPRLTAENLRQIAQRAREALQRGEADHWIGILYGATTVHPDPGLRLLAQELLEPLSRELKASTGLAVEHSGNISDDALWDAIERAVAGDEKGRLVTLLPIILSRGEKHLRRAAEHPSAFIRYFFYHVVRTQFGHEGLHILFPRERDRIREAFQTPGIDNFIHRTFGMLEVFASAGCEEAVQMLLDVMEGKMETTSDGDPDIAANTLVNVILSEEVVPTPLLENRAVDILERALERPSSEYAPSLIAEELAKRLNPSDPKTAARIARARRLARIAEGK